MDIKEKIEKIVDEIKSNPSIKEDFEKDPIKTVEGIIGVDLPDDAIEKVIDGVKAKISVDSISDAVGSIKGLFKK